MLINWMLKKLSITEEDDVEPSRRRVFIKILKSYEDVREVFAKYKSGEECIISLKKYVGNDIQEFINYICGGIHALEGYIYEAGDGVFLISHKNK